MCYASVHLFDTNSEKYIYEKKNTLNLNIS